MPLAVPALPGGAVSALGAANSAGPEASVPKKHGGLRASGERRPVVKNEAASAREGAERDDPFAPNCRIDCRGKTIRNMPCSKCQDPNPPGQTSPCR